LSVFLFFLTFFSSNSYSQDVTTDMFSLKLEDSGRKIENSISLEISASGYEAMQATTGAKISLRAKRVIINGDTLVPEEINTRGQSTLQFKRKSLSFKLNSEAEFRHGDRNKSFRKFSLLNLAMDKYYSHNRLSFEMMEATGIFSLFYSFCELRINGRSEGIFMIIERPEDWALLEKNSPLVLRRGYNHKIDKIKADIKSERTDTKKYIGYYRQIYRSLEKFEGEELFKTLSEWIDLDFYLKWLAFNFLVRNGDYSDEVFFYIDPEIGKYRIIPWDYDDIFALAPHEEIAEGKKATSSKLLFSIEDLLDKKIASDPYMYDIYLSRLKGVLNTLSPAIIRNVFEKCYGELYPYYSEKEIITNSQYDLYKDANLENLKNDLVTLYIEINGWRTSFLKLLEDANK
jgi:spore coat protein H